MEPNKENIKKWVDALRSGEFKQGIGMLKTPGGYYCCLGVACELYRLTTGLGSWGNEHWNGFSEFTAVDTPECHDYSDINLPDAVAEYLGLDTSPVVQVKPGLLENLTNLNDGTSLRLGCKHFSFYEIADLIEKEYLTDGNQ